VKTPRRQLGAALLALLGVVMLGGAWFLLYAVQPANRIVLDREHNAQVLREAKLAVLGWAVQNAMDSTDWNPGKLPCPEALGNFTVPPSASEGTMQGFCGGAGAAFGRLPWKSLGIERPQDASGEVLWYVVAPGWKRANNTTPEPALGINSNSIGAFTVDGVTPAVAGANAAVAAIIAPGRRLVTAPIASQTAQGCAAQSQFRTTFPPADSSHYLECQNIAGAILRTGVVENGTNEAFNDQVILITAADVLDAIEPVVVARITRDVVPQLQSAYVNASWGGTAAEPYFPFAVAYPGAASFDASASDYKGTLGTSQGLLPMTASTCNPPLTDGRCDSTFITWNIATADATCTAGCNLPNIFTKDCSASTITEVVCNVSFVAPLCALCFESASVTVSATGNNVGRAVRNLDSTAASGLTTLTAPLQSNGHAAASYTGTLAPTNIFGIPGLCGSFIGVLCTASATVRVPLTVFKESLVNPATSDAWYWFAANNWHHVTYFAMASPNMPGGARNCSGTASCLAVTFDVGASLTSKRAVLALAGRSVSGTMGASRTLADFLDTASNIDFNSSFEQKRVSRAGILGTNAGNGAFNDRFVTVTP
jgi:hypothetical protein